MGLLRKHFSSSKWLPEGPGAFMDFADDVISAEDENAGFRESVLHLGLDVSTLELQHELDMEWEQLFEDR